MERIKEALEKARAQQGQSKAIPASGPALDKAASASEEGITYSHTRVYKVSPAALREKRVIAGSQNDEAMAAYKMLRTQVLQRMVSRGWNSLAITSPGSGQGKTLTAVNLAVSLAREAHHTVLLVDLDMRNPRVHECFGLTPEKGISDFLLRGTPLSEILVNPGIERLVLLPGRESLPNSSEILSSPKMAQMVDELKSRYPSRFVLFDLPPSLSADDSLAFAPYVDAALLVIEEGKTTTDELMQTMNLLAQLQIVGTVLNKSSEKIVPYY